MREDAGLLSSVVETVFQSLAYGLFVVLVIVSTQLIVNRGWKTHNNIVMLSMIWAMFILSTLHWVISLIFTIAQIASLETLVEITHPLHDLVTAVGKINFGIADAVLVWRAWVICKHGYRKSLLICSSLLVLTFFALILTVILRLACNAHEVCPASVKRGLDVFQVGALIVSTMTNMTSTGIVGLYVWEFRQSIHAAFTMDGSTSGLRALLLIVESGLIYTVFVLFSVIGSVIRVPTGTVGDVSGSVLIYVSGIYPTIIIAIASVQGKINTSAFTVNHTQLSNALHRSHENEFAMSGLYHPTEESPGPGIKKNATLEDPPGTMVILSPLIFSDFETDAMNALDANSKKKLAQRSQK